MFLNVFPITCLPLRDRPDDIPSLTAHLLKIICLQLNRPTPKITERVIHQLQSYSWPGNVRELRNVIERGVIVSKGNKLQVELSVSTFSNGHSMDEIKTEAELQSIIRENLVSALRTSKGKVSGPAGVASILEMRPTTVYSRIKSFGISNSEWE